MQAFAQLPKDSSTGLPSNTTMQQFMATYFSPAGSDFDQISPSDFSSEPKGFLPNVTDPGVRSWALAVNDLWQDLVREVSQMQSCPPPALVTRGGAQVQLSSSVPCTRPPLLQTMCPHSVVWTAEHGSSA